MSDAITKSDLKEIISIREEKLISVFENAITKAVAPLQKSFTDALTEIRLLNQEVHKQGENITLLWNNHNEGMQEKRSLAIEISEIKKDTETNAKDNDGLGRKIEAYASELRKLNADYAKETKEAFNKIGDILEKLDDRCDESEKKLSNIHVIYGTVSAIFVIGCSIAGFIFKP